ncbi:MAG TPA: GAF domain-containing SpoIIE family protein phosphatase [Nocardioidaceae bacterium]|nr:GAF domain-containing SpoIIE family protein phosphatase [Nocardioidaceae bacterium]
MYQGLSLPTSGLKLQRIEAIAEAALAHLDVDDLLNELLTRIQELLAVDTAAVLLVDRSSQWLVATAARGLEAEVRQGFRLPIGTGFAGRVAAEMVPVMLDHVDETTVRNPVLREKGLRSLLGVPMLAGGRVTGVLHVGSLIPRQFSQDDVELLQLAAERAAHAVQSRESEVDRAAARALQRGLLPARLPPRSGVEMSARYIPGEIAGVGGDWYDVFELPAGGLGVVIGDVAGHGLDAAIVMGRLRSALRAYALEEDDPAVVLEKLSRKVDHFEPNIMATVIYAVFEPSKQRMHVSVAGHFPPVVARPGQPARLLDLPVDPPVGVPIETRRTSHAVDISPQSLLCFYTDGLVERRDDQLERNLERLCDVVTAMDSDLVCTMVMNKLVRDEPTHDDIAVLAIRRTT